MDYFVPNFGKDKLIKETWSSLDWAEKNRGHKWVLPPDWDKKKDEFEDHRIPDFGLDEDIVDTIDNTQKTEKTLKHKWTPKQDENGVWLVPTPIDNNSYKYHPDQDEDTLVQLNEKSDPICDSAHGCVAKGSKTHPMNYFVPNFGVDHDIKTSHESLDWAEQELNHKWVFNGYPDKKDEPPKNYFVPNFGQDEEIAWTQKNIADASSSLGHDWQPE